MNNKLMVGIVSGVVLGATAISQCDAASMMYTKTNLNLRKTASSSSLILKSMPKGAKVTVLSTDRYGWAKVNYNGINGYCSAQYLVKTTTTSTTNVTPSNTTTTNNTTTSAKYTSCALILRNAPSGSKILTMAANSKVTVISTSNGWSKVNYNGISGYCSSQYLCSSVNNSNVLVTKITISKSSHTLNCYSNGTLVKSFKCAVGKSTTPTPSGNFSILSREKNRPYYKNNIPGGSPQNPLGSRFLLLRADGIAIHGTNAPNSIGTSASHGCIRMHNSDVEWVYDHVRCGCSVSIY